MKLLYSPLLAGIKILFFSSVAMVFLFFTNTDVLGKEVVSAHFSNPHDTVIKTIIPSTTKTYFEIKTETVTSPLAYATEVRNSDELEIGTTEVNQSGTDGQLTETYEVEYYYGEEFNRRLVNSTRIESQTEIIIKGTKIIWRTIEIDGSVFSYWKKLDVYATPYTAESAGKAPGSAGFGITATGTLAHFGTIAVDPTLIPLGTKMYIPGYGYGTAEDTGGAIKGNIIDLFYDGNHGWWNSHSVEIYLIT